MLRQHGTDYIYTEYQQEHLVKRYDVHPFLRNLKPDQLRKYSDAGNRLKAIKLNDGSYIVRPHGELKGGGPGLAWVAYVSINIASAAGAAALGWCPPAAAAVAVGGHIVATAAAVSLSITPTP